LLATSQPHQKLQVFRFISIFIFLPLCQQFNKKERKEERKLELDLGKLLFITGVRGILFSLRDSVVRPKIRARFRGDVNRPSDRSSSSGLPSDPNTR
jgi:hypothetical protein